MDKRFPRGVGKMDERLINSINQHGLPVNVIINSLIIRTTIFDKIPPILPLLKGGMIPLFGKEGKGRFSEPCKFNFETRKHYHNVIFLSCRRVRHSSSERFPTSGNDRRNAFVGGKMETLSLENDAHG